MNSEDARKISDYLARFEQYNKTYIYGSEILSLANLQDDYNRTQSDTEGYSRVNIYITINTPIEQADGRLYYLTVGRKNITEIANGIIGRTEHAQSLENAISYYETTVYGNTKKTYKYLSQISSRQLAGILGVSFRSDDDEFAVQDKIENAGYRNLLEEIEKYKILKSTYTQFKNTQFMCTDVKYDEVGRIKEMDYEERVIGP